MDENCGIECKGDLDIFYIGPPLSARWSRQGCVGLAARMVGQWMPTFGTVVRADVIRWPPQHSSDGSAARATRPGNYTATL